MSIGEVRTIAVVNENDEVIDSILDKDVLQHPEYITRGVGIIIFNEKKELFLQKRSRHKYRFPHFWDCSVGGKVDAEKSYEETAISEAKEELGITISKNDLKFVSKLFIDSDSKEFVTIYQLKHNGPFQIELDEISEGKFCSVQELKEMLKKEEPFTPVLIQALLQLNLQA